MRKAVTSACCIAALVAPVGSAFAVARTVRASAKIARVVVTHEVVDGPIIKCHRWGFMEVQLNVIQTEKIVGTKKTVSSVKITGVQLARLPQPHAALDLHQHGGVVCGPSAAGAGDAAVRASPHLRTW